MLINSKIWSCLILYNSVYLVAVLINSNMTGQNLIYWVPDMQYWYSGTLGHGWNTWDIVWDISKLLGHQNIPTLPTSPISPTSLATVFNLPEIFQEIENAPDVFIRKY